MKKLLLAGCLLVSVSVFSAETTTAPANPSAPSAADADIPGTLVKPTQKQLKSVKKPKKETAVTTPTSTPTSTPSH